MPSYRIEIAKRARKQLWQLPVRTQERIAEAIGILGSNPLSPVLDIKPLVNYPKGYFRLRAGAYGVIYILDDMIRIIQIIRIGHRKEVYQ